MKILLNLILAVVCIGAFFLLLLAWRADGLNGVEKMFSLLILIPCSIWVAVWIGRGIYWMVIIILASFFIGIESTARQIKKIVHGK